MERTAADKGTSALLDIRIGTEHVHDVIGVTQTLDEFIRKPCHALTSMISG